MPARVYFRQAPGRKVRFGARSVATGSLLRDGVSVRGDLHVAGHRFRRDNAGARAPYLPWPKVEREVPELRDGRDDGYRPLASFPRTLLRLRVALFGLRRGGRLPVPVGCNLQEPRRLRFRGDGYLCLDPGCWVGLRLEEGSPQVGVMQQFNEPNLITTSTDKLFNWARKNSLWPLQFGLACCAIEMMSTGMAHNDLDRFGAGFFAASPRQADVMIVSGTVSTKMAERMTRLYEQMPEPKWVIAMGACAISGGPFLESLPEREYTEISEGKAQRFENIRPLKRTYVFEREGMPPASQTDVGWIPKEVKKKLKEQKKAEQAATEAGGQKNGSPEEPADAKGTA